MVPLQWNHWSLHCPSIYSSQCTDWDLRNILSQCTVQTNSQQLNGLHGRRTSCPLNSHTHGRATALPDNSAILLVGTYTPLPKIEERLLWAKLYPPKFEVIILSTSECDYTWWYSFLRGDKVKNEFIRVNCNPIWPHPYQMTKFGQRHTRSACTGERLSEEAARGQPPTNQGEATTLLIPWFQISSLKNCE